eukprot:11210240-Lingulodinium_polyedra.AAC.1
MNSVLTETLRDIKSLCNISELSPIDRADPATDTSGRRQADDLLRAAVDKYNTVKHELTEDRWQAVDIDIAFVGE